jgi:hypothetical protein
VRLRAAVSLRARPQDFGEKLSRANLAKHCRHIVLAKPNAMHGNELKWNALRPRSPLAQRIEHVFARPNSHPKRATFSIGRGNARVHIILQTKGERATLLAVCRPEERLVVARALTQARFALASLGIGIALHEAGAVGCS